MSGVQTKIKVSTEYEKSSKLSPDWQKIRKIERANRLDQQYLEANGMGKKLSFLVQRQLLSYHFLRPPIWKTLLRARLNSERMRPDFALIGAVRSGTTMLSNYIMQHPCIALPLAKEIGLDVPTEKLILAQFPTQKTAASIRQRYGNATTGYCTPLMPRLDFPYFAAALNDQIKLIVILRDPVDRAFAQWRWDQVLLRRVKGDSLWRNYPTFDQIIRLEIEYAQQLASISGFAISGPGGGYIQLSHYLPFLQKLFEFFDKENALYVNASDFFKQPVATAKRIYDF